MAEVTIRSASGAGDLALVRALMLEYAAHLAAAPSGAASICLKGYEAELAGLPQPYLAPGGLLLAEVEGEAAGCIAIKPLKDGALELKRLWVRPGHRGLRLGRRLIEAAIEQARVAGAAAVYLDTVPAAMPEANRLYEALGFERTERYNDNPVEDVVFFRLRLDARGAA